MSVLISVCFVLKFSYTLNVAGWNQFANDFGECWLISDGHGQVNKNESFFRRIQPLLNVCLILGVFLFFFTVIKAGLKNADNLSFSFAKE